MSQVGKDLPNYPIQLVGRLSLTDTGLARDSFADLRLPHVVDLISRLVSGTYPAGWQTSVTISSKADYESIGNLRSDVNGR